MLAGDDPLTEVSFEREEIEEAEENQGIWGPWTLVLTIFNKLMVDPPHLQEGVKGDMAVGQVGGDVVQLVL